MTVYIPEDPTRMMRAKRSRYGNKKVNYMGMTFDSVGERDRFIISKTQSNADKSAIFAAR